MTRAAVRAMAVEEDVWVVTSTATDRVAGVFLTPPPLPTPRLPPQPAYVPYAQGGRPPTPTPQAARRVGKFAFTFFITV